MSEYQRMIYASRATFAPVRREAGIELEVARILMQSRRNNPGVDLVGALYYGDGCFFQCLEGEASAIDALCAKIEKDPRHKEIKVLGRHPIQSRSFSVWAMKYVPNASEVQALMARHGRKTFDPYTFDQPLIAAMVDMLRQANDADQLNLSADGQRRTGDRPAPPAAPPVRARTANSRWLIGAAALLAVVAIAWWFAAG